MSNIIYRWAAASPTFRVFTFLLSHSLLDAGADPNSHLPVTDATQQVEKAPLHIICASACSESSTITSSVAVEVVQDLLSYGAKISSATMELLPIAAHRGRLRAVELLVKYVGVDPNFRGRQGMTSLILSSRSGKVDVVKFLLEIETLELDTVDDSGKRAIDYAVANGKDIIVRLLTERN